MIGEAQSLGERKRKDGGVKEMIQDATKLTHKLRFLVEEVCNLFVVIRDCFSSHSNIVVFTF